MNFLSIICVLALSAYCCRASTVQEFELDEGTQKTLTRLISLGLMRGFQSQVHSKQIHFESDDNTRATLFPPQNETLELNDLFLAFPEDLDLKEILVGNLAFTQVVVNGLDSVVHDLAVGPVLPDAKVKFTLSAGNITLGGVHDTTLSILFASHNLTGADNFRLNLVNLETKIETSIFVNLLNGKITIRTFSIELDYEDFSIDLGATKLNNVQIAWPYTSTIINNAFDALWPRAKEAIETLVLEDLNQLLSKCKFGDLIAGNFECLFPKPIVSTTPEASTDPENTGSTTVEITDPESTGSTLIETSTESDAATEATTPAGASRITKTSTIFLVALPLMYFKF